ncbi:hypothetical protein DICVIV_13295 [Dictyocaulus viviparus]|uniref:Uncharacterized protein n=1 Tax=Dictyocaulus viviparus TaxID=29172 RepID=A0A0D8XEA5_DICVI|nr:hypothetical protein DICVIV_13295 [Dictyocaulus viviparus]
MHFVGCDRQLFSFLPELIEVTKISKQTPGSKLIPLDTEQKSNIKMKIWLLFKVAIWMTSWKLLNAESFNEIELYDVNDPRMLVDCFQCTSRSRLLMIDGHMLFHAGRNKNITFLTSGSGTIFVDQTDISKLPELKVTFVRKS